MDYVKVCAEAVKQQPVMVRLGTDTEKRHYTDEMLKALRDVAKPRIKLSGEIDLKTIEGHKVDRFDVSLAQARLILRQADNRKAKELGPPVAEKTSDSTEVEETVE